MPGRNWKILIDFKLLSGESSLLSAWRGDTIDNVKATLQGKMGFPADRVQLVFQDVELEGAYGVWEYNLEHLNVVNVVCRSA